MSTCGRAGRHAWQLAAQEGTTESTVDVLYVCTGCLAKRVATVPAGMS